jgi:putative lipoic acid-binding regulatory protein
MASREVVRAAEPPLRCDHCGRPVRETQHTRTSYTVDYYSVQAGHGELCSFAGDDGLRGATYVQVARPLRRHLVWSAIGGKRYRRNASPLSAQAQRRLAAGKRERSGGEEYPTIYTFKIFGRRSDTFVDRVRAIIADTLGAVPLDAVKVRESSQGRYLSVTVLARVESRSQLERVYADLRADETVLLYI